MFTLDGVVSGWSGLVSDLMCAVSILVSLIRVTGAGVGVISGRRYVRYAE